MFSAKDENVAVRGLAAWRPAFAGGSKQMITEVTDRKLRTGRTVYTIVEILHIIHFI